MKSTIFATVNGQNIIGEDIIRERKRIIIEHEKEHNFAYTPNEDNNQYLNSEALQKIIEKKALLALAKYEGITPTDEEITEIIVELRQSFEDEAEWESNLHDLGLSDSNLREEITIDTTIDMLIQSHSENHDEPSEDDAAEFYQQNINFMKHPGAYSFIELEVPSMDQIQKISPILAHNDVSSILKEAAEQGINCVHNEEIPSPQLPEELNSMLEDLEETKIGSLPADDGSIILIKLLKKHPETIIPEEDAISGLQEYLKIQQIKQIFDELLEYALEKCDIAYLSPEELKNLN